MKPLKINFNKQRADERIFKQVQKNPALNLLE